MNIVYYGLNCFKIQGKDIALVTDSFDKEVGLKPYFGSSDIVTVSSDDKKYNNTEALKGDFFVVDGAGEYEIKKTVIKGIESENNNIIYKIILDGVKMCHLGALKQKELTSAQLDKIGDVDVLFVPVGGKNVLDAKDAENIISQIEPRVIIPMFYKVDDLKGELEDLDTVNSFCQKSGVECEEPVAKFVFKKKDLPVEDSQYVVIDLGK